MTQGKIRIQLNPYAVSNGKVTEWKGINLESRLVLYDSSKETLIQRFKTIEEEKALIKKLTETIEI